MKATPRKNILVGGMPSQIVAQKTQTIVTSNSPVLSRVDNPKFLNNSIGFIAAPSNGIKLSYNASLQEST
jgi:hypothetical protein